jgi:hypothetical protein
MSSLFAWLRARLEQVLLQFRFRLAAANGLFPHGAGRRGPGTD